MNSVCWAPHYHDLILACGNSDEAISLLTYTGEGQWEVKKINNAHTVSPAPAFCMEESSCYIKVFCASRRVGVPAERWLGRL